MATASHSHPYHSPTRTADPARWRVLTLLCLAQAMLVVDITVVNVALPSMGSELELSRVGLTWIVTGYTLAFGGLMLTGGRLADLYGRRRILLIGLAVFTLASLTAGLAGNGAVLLSGRFAQGIGAALLSPAALSTITTLFQGTESHRALGVWSAVGGAGAAVGVLVGGGLTSGPGWQWAFLINVPIGAVVWWGLPKTVFTPTETLRRRLDIPGAVLVTTATAALVFALVRAGDDGWNSPAAWGSLAASVVAYFGFFLVESRTAQPLIQPTLLVRRSILSGVFIMLTATALLISFFFLGSLYLQSIAHASPLRTGLLFLPTAVAVTAGAHLAGRVIGRMGPRPLAVTGLLITSGGAAWLIGLDAAGVMSRFLPGVTLAAFGLGMLFVAATTTAMATVTHHEAGVASGIVNTFHELGGAIGVAVMSTVAAGSIGVPVPTTAGFTDAFTLCAIVAAASAAVALAVVPAGRVDTAGISHVH